MSCLRRSLLYVPASSEKMLQKAGRRGADVLILDLEDGVHPEAKVDARQRLAESLHALDFGSSEVLVRVNSPESPWGLDDLDRMRDVRPAGVVLPKAGDPAEVQAVDEKLERATALYLMVETAAGVLAAPQLARCSPRVGGLAFGAADYRESLRAGRHPEELELHFARSQILLAARAAGIEAFDTPWFNYEDSEGLERSARRVRQMGFDGKTAIHPSQVAVINEIFAPTASEIARSRRIVAVMEEALRQGRNVATLDGEMVEALHLDEARRTLKRAEALGLTGENSLG
jgi:citrate lyase subunit beta/citryl-CoA lyase